MNRSSSIGSPSAVTSASSGKALMLMERVLTHSALEYRISKVDVAKQHIS